MNWLIHRQLASLLHDFFYEFCGYAIDDRIQHRFDLGLKVRQANHSKVFGHEFGAEKGVCDKRIVDTVEAKLLPAKVDMRPVVAGPTAVSFRQPKTEFSADACYATLAKPGYFAVRRHQMRIVIRNLCLIDLDQIAAGVVKHCDGGRASLGWSGFEFDIQTRQSFVFELHVDYRKSS